MPSGLLTVVQGSDSILRITAKDLAGNPIDLSVAEEIKWALYETAAQDSDALLSKKLSTAEISLPNGGGDGVFDVALSTADTKSLAATVWQWQARLTIGGKERVCQAGLFDNQAAGDFDLV